MSQPKETNELIPHKRKGATSVCVRALYGPYNNMRQMGKAETNPNLILFML